MFLFYQRKNGRHKRLNCTNISPCAHVFHFILKNINIKKLSSLLCGFLGSLPQKHSKNMKEALLYS